MAVLVIQSEGIEKRVLNLRLGSNVVGRHPACDFQIEHGTVSSRHCEFILSPEGVLLRDFDSTNGTFVNCEPVKEIWLEVGQIVNVGDIALLVENTEIIIAIPKYLRPNVAVGVGSPVVLPQGVEICARHPQLLAIYKCQQCSEVMCGKCVRSIKRQGGAALLLCSICNGKCMRISTGPKKKTFLDTLRATVKMPFEALARTASKK